MSRVAISALLAVVLVGICAGRAQGQAAQAALDYRADESCPSREAVVRAVELRLGYAPFTDGTDTADAAADTADAAGEVLRVRIDRIDAQWRATVEWVSAGVSEGLRELSSTDASCRTLAGTVALAIVIALDPMASGGPLDLPAAEARTAQSDAPSSATGPRSLPPEKQPHSSWSWRAGAGPLASIGSAPSWAPGVAAMLGLARGRIALALHAQAHLPRAEAAGPGQVKGWLATGALAACLRRDAHSELGMCGLLSLGVLRGRGTEELDAGRSTTKPYAGIGTRIYWTKWWRDALGLRLYGDLRLALLRTALTVNAQDVWELPPASAAIGLLGITRW